VNQYYCATLILRGYKLSFKKTIIGAEYAEEEDLED
jgi:hypothetical protein